MEGRTKFKVGSGLILAVVFGAILLLGLSLSGCSQVQMSPAYRQQLEMTNIIVQSLNEDCKGGDPNACAKGLNESAGILQLLVDAVHGTVSKGGDEQ